MNPSTTLANETPSRVNVPSPTGPIEIITKVVVVNPSLFQVHTHKESIYSFNAEADCCSESWFETATRKNIHTDTEVSVWLNEKLVGHPIMLQDLLMQKVSTDTELLPATGRQEYDQYVKFAFIDATTDEELVTLQLINSSNGYYSGWLQIEHNTFLGVQIITNLSARIVLVLGHSGSGKTTYLRTFTSSSPQYVMDDYMDSPTWVNSMYEALQTGRRVILSDPRLCITRVFKTHFEILDNILPHPIHIVAFRNNIEQCNQNVIAREHTQGDTLENLTLRSHEYDSTLAYIRDNKLGRLSLVDVYSPPTHEREHEDDLPERT